MITFEIHKDYPGNSAKTFTNELGQKVEDQMESHWFSKDTIRLLMLTSLLKFVPKKNESVFMLL